MIRRFLKKILPDPIIGKLRRTKKFLYNVGPGFILRKRANYYKKRIQEEEIVTKKTKTVVFIAMVPASWNSLKPVYEEAKRRTDIEEKLLIVPPINNSLDKSNFEYFKTIEPNAVDAYENQKWIDLKKIKPDFIFQQTPYDHQLPRELRSSYTVKFSQICYVPYGYNSSPDKHLDIEYNEEFVMNVSKIFADNLTSYKYCLDRFTKQRGYHYIQVYNYGFPRFDFCRDKNKKLIHNLNIKRQFMWIPRWSVDSVNNDATSFFLYKEKLIDYFVGHPDCELVIRPHPLMFDNFVKLGIMTPKEVGMLKKEIQRIQNIRLDNAVDYWIEFDKTDVLIADYSSLDIEFFLTGRPIIYCGALDCFNKQTERMLREFYLANTWEELENHLDRLVRDNDYLYEKRQATIKEFLYENQDHVAKRIIDNLILQ